MMAERADKRLGEEGAASLGRSNRKARSVRDNPPVPLLSEVLMTLSLVDDFLAGSRPYASKEQVRRELQGLTESLTQQEPN